MNIEIGIDLGTTNSEIAVFTGGEVRIIKNYLRDEFTPSAFGITKGRDEIVGKRAYDKYYEGTQDEVANNKLEVKRLMGTSEKVLFPRIAKSYNAEEISAKILKFLVQEAKRSVENLNTVAAVITIPAHFSTLQAEATKRAGEIAGFKQVILLQEPIAAAFAYGFGKNKNENWLIYDLGGGTFDVALISSRDGHLTVLNHNGDNFLGGKDIDNIIVNEIFLPVLEIKHNLSLSRSDPRQAAVFARLKIAAEQAKIQLSSMKKIVVSLDLEIEGEEIYEEIEISQDLLKQKMMPVINRTLNYCKDTIDQAGVKPEAIARIVLVGGPTQLPFLRETLEKELRIKTDTSCDPLTVVARGACLYGASQLIVVKSKEKKVLPPNVFDIQLNYDSLTSENETFVTGKIQQLENRLQQYFIQIQTPDNTFNSGRLNLKNGKFAVNLPVSKNLNTFALSLFDNEGNKLGLSPDSFTISHGLSVDGTPIPNSVGLGVSRSGAQGVSHVFDVFFEKNSILPLSKTKSYKTVSAIKRGDETNILPITAYEGENMIPDRNTFIFEIGLNGKEIGVDLPENSDVDVTINIDESRTIGMEAYIPAIDKTFNARMTTYDQNISVDALIESAAAISGRIKDIEDQQLKEDLTTEFIELEKCIKNAVCDEDEKRKANSRLKKLQSSVDAAEWSARGLKLKNEFKKCLGNIPPLIEKLEDAFQRKDFSHQFEALKKEGETALADNNIKIIEEINNKLYNLWGKMLAEFDDFWKDMLRSLLERPQVKSDARVAYYVFQAEEALKNNKMKEIKEIVQALLAIIPKDERGKIPGIRI